ncbi:hypothetical protein HY990_04330 [Candidatus Micrarchaeota archaeon]|nr:hypothetical protein [Candidatus Micrarchaeota archaeon]
MISKSADKKRGDRNAGLSASKIGREPPVAESIEHRTTDNFRSKKDDICTGRSSSETLFRATPKTETKVDLGVGKSQTDTKVEDPDHLDELQKDLDNRLIGAELSNEQILFRKIESLIEKAGFSNDPDWIDERSEHAREILADLDEIEKSRVIELNISERVTLPKLERDALEVTNILKRVPGIAERENQRKIDDPRQLKCLQSLQ